MEALPARAGHQRELLGLQRRGGGLLRGARLPHARRKWASSPSKLPVRTSRWPIGSKFADTDERGGKGLYVIRDFTPGKPKHGHVVAQGSSATFNLVQMLLKLEEAGINVKVISAISEELFDHQPESYRNSLLPLEAVYDLMFISSGTRRMWPLRNVGPMTDGASMTSDFHSG